MVGHRHLRVAAVVRGEDAAMNPHTVEGRAGLAARWKRMQEDDGLDWPPQVQKLVEDLFCALTRAPGVAEHPAAAPQAGEQRVESVVRCAKMALGIWAMERVGGMCSGPQRERDRKAEEVGTWIDKLAALGLPRLDTYAPDGSTCSISGVYYDRRSASAGAGQAEAVAWRYRLRGLHQDDARWTLSPEDPANDKFRDPARWEWEPLYSAPPASAPEWRSIKSAPRDGTEVLLLDVGDGTRVVGRWGKHNHVPIYGWIRQVELYGEEVDGFDCASHWMPLPAAPTGESRTP